MCYKQTFLKPFVTHFFGRNNAREKNKKNNVLCHKICVLQPASLLFMPPFQKFYKDKPLKPFKKRMEQYFQKRTDCAKLRKNFKKTNSFLLTNSGSPAESPARIKRLAPKEIKTKREARR